MHFYDDRRVVNAGFKMIAAIRKMRATVRLRSMLRFNTESYHDRYRTEKCPRRTGSNNDEVHSGNPGELFPYNRSHRRDRTGFYSSARRRNDRCCHYHRSRAVPIRSQRVSNDFFSVIVDQI